MQPILYPLRLTMDTELDIKTKALLVIEALELMQNKQDSIYYRMAHVGLGQCGNSHKEWARELDGYYEWAKKRGLI